ncbi:MAG TPA: hypothetical protein QGF58_21925 [Myxococcota bacterium]|nr:hypothetical protein [Myxococcota bacterium]
MTALLLLPACMIEYGVDGKDPDVQAPIGDPEDAEYLALPDAPVYANTSTTLYRLDEEELSTLGDFSEDGVPVDGMTDIAIDREGLVVGGTFDAIYTIDAETAELTHVCDTDIVMYALAFSSDGRLFAGGDNVIEEIDLSDCSGSVLTTSQYLTSGDLVGLPDGYLYWTVEGDDGDELVRLDPDNGFSQWVGVIGVERLFGLGFTNDELFGFSADGTIVAVDPDTAETFETSTQGPGWWGATTNPVVW